MHASHLREKPQLLVRVTAAAAIEPALAAGADWVELVAAGSGAGRPGRVAVDSLVDAAATVHAAGARLRLALEADIAQRDVVRMARLLQAAADAKVDAVLVRDPAALLLRRHYPFAFHFAPGGGIANHADAAAARRLGADRAVLARELSDAEIARAAAEGIEIETVVEAELCRTVTGGRSSTRASSPRRGERHREDEPTDAVDEVLRRQPLASRLRPRELLAAGVTCFRVECPPGDSSAVEYYRRALDDAEAAPAVQRPVDAYSVHAAAEPAAEASADNDAAPDADSAAGDDAGDAAAGYAMSIDIEDRGIVCVLRLGDFERQWTLPKTVVRRQHKAVTIEQVFAHLGRLQLHGKRLGDGRSNQPQFLLVPRAANALIDRVAALVRQAGRLPSDPLRAEISAEVRAALEEKRGGSWNRRLLGQQPDRVRLDARGVADFVRQVRPEGLVVEGLSGQRVSRTVAAVGGIPLVAALPPVAFDEDLTALRRLIDACAEAHVAVEVNSWAGWQLARQGRATIEAGPGLAVYNAAAARLLKRQGARSVTLAALADVKALEELCQQLDVAASLVVFARPPLAITRVAAPDDPRPRRDDRGAALMSRAENGLRVFRPVEPLDLRGERNERVAVEHLVVDLVGSPDPLDDWFGAPLTSP